MWLLQNFWLVHNKFSCAPAHHLNALHRLHPSASLSCLFKHEPSCPTPSPALAFLPTYPVLLPFLPVLLLPPRGVQMYRRWITHVLRMTKLAAILTPHSAEWIGKYRAVEERSIHPGVYLQRDDFFFRQKCTLHLQKDRSSTLDEYPSVNMEGLAAGVEVG